MSKIAKVTTLLLFGALVLETGAATAQGCPGDMNGDRNVSVSELVTAVTSALEGCPFPPEPRFVDNENGTITDRTTGLMWEKKVHYPPSLDESPLDRLHDVWLELPNSGVCMLSDRPCSNNSGCIRFDPDRDEGPCDLSGSIDAIEWVDEVNRARFANHSDWRLPTIQELMGIYEYVEDAPVRGEPRYYGNHVSVPEAFLTLLCSGQGNDAPGDPRQDCTDLADPACSCTRNQQYLSSTIVFERGFMSLDFDDGGVVAGGYDRQYVRAVRSIR